MKIFRAIVAFLFFPTGCQAAPGEISKIFPWIESNNVSLGMTRAELVKSRPAAIQIFIPDTPPPPEVPFRGAYVEGEKPESDNWIYLFKDGLLCSVAWTKKNNSTEADTAQIRRRLIGAYGDPQVGNIARINTAGKIEKITQELYLTAKRGGFAVYLVATDEGGIEVTAMAVSDSEYPSEPFERSLTRLKESGLSQNDGTPTIIDILAKILEPKQNSGK